MPSYKEVRTRGWFTKLYAEEYEGQEYPLHEVDIDIKHVNTAFLDWIMMIEDSGQNDLILLLEFKDQFSEWSQELFNACDLRIRKAMKDLFRARGIYIAFNQQETLTEQFSNLLKLTACPLW